MFELESSSSNASSVDEKPSSKGLEGFSLQKRIKLLLAHVYFEKLYVCTSLVCTQTWSLLLDSSSLSKSIRNTSE